MLNQHQFCNNKPVLSVIYTIIILQYSYWNSFIKANISAGNVIFSLSLCFSLLRCFMRYRRLGSSKIQTCNLTLWPEMTDAQPLSCKCMKHNEWQEKSML